MQKKNLKPLILSSLAATAMVAVGTGATFALFTDKAQTQINVQAGVIDVGTSASIFKVFEYDGTEGGLEVEATAEDDYTNSIGGTTKKLQDGTFGLGNWAPGDRVQIKVNAFNASTVKAKIRLKAVLSGELAGALVVKIGNDSFTTVELAAHGARTLVTDWTEFDPGSNPANFGLEVSFPNVGTEITSRGEGENNLYQGKSASLLVTYEAVQANASVASSLLERANTILATNSVKEGANATFSQALGDFTAEMKAQLIASPYVYGIEEDQFYETSSVAQGNEYRYFKPMSSDDASGYSIYAKPDWATASVDLVGRGFDAGDASGISSVSYVGIENTPRTNYIVTNNTGTAITINAPLDTVYHHGDAGNLNIVAVANSSYHEFGTVSFAEISKGRLALENGGSIDNLHINSKKDANNVTTNEFDKIIVSLADQVSTPEFSRDTVEISGQGTLVVAIQNGTEDITEETNLDYIWLTKMGIFEQIKVTDNDESMENAVWADDQSLDDSATQDAALDIANNISRADPNDKKSPIDVEVSITKEETKTYKVILNEQRDLIVVDKEDDEETPLATLDDQTSNVQVGTSEFEVALKSSEENAAELVVSNVNDEKEVYSAEAVIETGLSEEEKAKAKQAAEFKKFIDQGYSFVVGDTGYKTLKEAFDAVEDNQTVNLIQDLKFEVSPEETTKESVRYWQGSGISNTSVRSYIHLHNKKGITFNMNGFTMDVDYSFNILDAFPTDYSSDKAFMYLSGEGSLDIINGTMNVRFDYKNRARTGSSIYNSGYTYAAIYVLNSPDNPGGKNPTAVYDIPYQTELSMVNCSLTTNQLPLYLHHGARVTELNADLKYYCEKKEISSEGKTESIYDFQIQNNNYHAIYMRAGSKIDKITGGSYISCDQRELDDPGFGLQNQGSALFVEGAYSPSATYYPNVHVPKAEVGLISGGTFKSNGNYPIEIKGYVHSITGGLFGRIEGTYAGRNTLYFNPTILLPAEADGDGIGSITGGTFVAGYNPSRLDPLNNMIARKAAPGSVTMTYPSLADFVGEGYTTVKDEGASFNVTTSRTQEPIVIHCDAYKVVANN